MKFDKFILRKIIKIVVTREIVIGHILKLKCTECDFGWAVPQTPLKKLTALPRLLSWI